MTGILKYRLYEDNRYYWIVLTDSRGTDWTSENLDGDQARAMLQSIKENNPGAERLPDHSDPT